MKYKFFLLLIVSLCSCEKGFMGIGDNKASDYMPLEVGNYWIYETSSERPDGTIYSSYDTINIEKDTTIGSYTFSILEGTKFGMEYKALFRTDGKRLITSQEQILLDCQDEGSPLQDSVFTYNGDTIYTVQYNTTKLPDENTINLPAGSYSDLFIHSRTYSIHQSHDGINESPLTTMAYYAKNVGLVKDQTFYLNSGLGIMIELLEYGKKD